MEVIFESDDQTEFRGMNFGYTIEPNFDVCQGRADECIRGTCGPSADRMDVQCECPDGWEGQFCGDDLDECASDPCQNGGECKQLLPPGYTCVCTDAWYGEHCEIEVFVDPCESNPCHEDATCQTLFNEESYKCICAEGYDGETCQDSIDDCSSSPCQNGATCTDGHMEYTCECTEEFEGDHCQFALGSNGCLHAECPENAVCEMTDEEGGFECVCPPGLGGDNCDEELFGCDSNPCLNEGTCEETEDGDGTYTCICSEYHYGVHCENRETYCTNPGIPFEEDTTWETGSTLHFYCVEGYTLLGEASLKCENNVWSSVEVPVCVDENNNTVEFLPPPLSTNAKLFIALTTIMAPIVAAYFLWLGFKGPWSSPITYTKVEVLAPSLTSTPITQKRQIMTPLETIHE